MSVEFFWGHDLLAKIVVVIESAPQPVSGDRW